MPSCVFRWCTNYTTSVRNKKNVSFHTLPKYGPMKDTWLNVIRNQRSEDDWMPTIYSTVCSEHFLTSDFITTQKNMRRLKKNAVPVIKIENDTDNFVQFKLVGGTLKIKPNINPHKFDCQKPYEERSRMECGQVLNKEVSSSSSSESLSCERFECDKRIKTEDPVPETHSVYIKRSPSDDEMEEDNDETITIETSVPGAPENVSISISEPVDDGNLSDSDLSCSDVDEAIESIKASIMRKELKKKSELLKKTQNKVKSLQTRNQRLSKKVASLQTIVKTYREGKCCCHAKISDDSDSK
ncbi:unnamed protein product [Colias eurytheme]|nr:unnamed protein product [Colias eurytheme]